MMLLGRQAVLGHSTYSMYYSVLEAMRAMMRLVQAVVHLVQSAALVRR